MARPKSDRRSVRLSVTLDEDDHKAVREMADSMDLSTAWIVPRAVSEFIKRHEREERKKVVSSDVTQTTSLAAGDKPGGGLTLQPHIQAPSTMTAMAIENDRHIKGAD